MDPQALIAPKDFIPSWNYQIKTPEYHSDKNAVNSSSLKKMLKSPLAFKQSFWGDQEEPSDAMKFGTLAHLAILQGEKFRSKYIVMPEFESRTADGKISESKNTKFYKDQVAEWKKGIAQDAIVCTAEERDKLFGMIESIVNHPMAYELLKDGSPEICGYWKDEETGIRCRMQADFVSFNLGSLIDVKTTSDSDWNEFRKSVENYKYPFQMAMYAEGIKSITGKRPEHILWIAVESKAPYEVRVFELSPHYEEIGHYEFRSAMRKLKECIDLNKFDGLQKEIEIVEPSYWYFKQYEDKIIFT